MNRQAEELIKLSRKGGTNLTCKVISVSSGKGGVGKTNLSVSLSYALSNVFSRSVLLIDADVGLGNIHLLLNAVPAKTVKNVLEGEDIEDVIQRCYGFDVLLGFSGVESLSEIEEVNVANLVHQLSRISHRYDYIVFDTSAGIDGKVLNFLRNSDSTYVVTTPEPTALTDAYALIKTLSKIYSYESFKVIVNMYRSKMEALSTFEKLEYACSKFLNLNLLLAGTIPFSKRVRDAVKERRLLIRENPFDPFSEAVVKIAGREAGTPPRKRSSNFWQKLFNLAK